MRAIVDRHRSGRCADQHPAGAERRGNMCPGPSRSAVGRRIEPVSTVEAGGRERRQTTAVLVALRRFDRNAERSIATASVLGPAADVEASRAVREVIDRQIRPRPERAMKLMRSGRHRIGRGSSCRLRSRGRHRRRCDQSAVEGPRRRRSSSGRTGEPLFRRQATDRIACFGSRLCMALRCFFVKGD